MKKEGKYYDLGDLIREVVERTGADLETVTAVLKAGINATADALAHFERVEYKDFGVIRLRPRQARAYVFGDSTFEVPAHHKVVFKAAPALAAVIAEKRGELIK